MRRKAIEETEVVDRSSPANLDRTEFPADKIRRLTRRVPEADEAVEPRSKAPEDREPEAEPSARPSVAPAEANSKSARPRAIAAAAAAVRAAAGRAGRRRICLRDRRRRSCPPTTPMCRPTWSASRPTSPASSRDRRCTTTSTSQTGDVLFSSTTSRSASRSTAPMRSSARCATSSSTLQASYKQCRRRSRRPRPTSPSTRPTFKRQQDLVANNFTPRRRPSTRPSTTSTAHSRSSRRCNAAAGRHRRQPQRRRPTQPVEQHPRYQGRAGRARRGRAPARRIRSCRAPFAGIVTNVPSLQPGQYLAGVDQRPFSLVSDRPRLGRRPSPKETELTYVEPGPEGDGRLSTPIRAANGHGTVESISPASASSFSLLPAQNTSGNWVKVVQRIPMRVRVDDVAGKPPLRVGMSVERRASTPAMRAACRTSLDAALRLARSAAHG